MTEDPGKRKIYLKARITQMKGEIGGIARSAAKRGHMKEQETARIKKLRNDIATCESTLEELDNG